MEGLSEVKAKELLHAHGPNTVSYKKSASLARLFFEQTKSMLVSILVVAATLSFFVGDKTDALLILAILTLNIFLGVWQSHKASRELEALQGLTVAQSRVIRGGRELQIASVELVPGDLIILEAGDKVPADCVLVDAHDLTVNESILTGEAMPVVKSTHKDSQEIFQSTVVISGKARAIVKTTGKNTRFGSIARTLSEIKNPPTPLEISLDSLGKKIGIFAVIMAMFLFILRVIQNTPLIEAFFVSIAFMVAVVPEGLPTLITLALTLGARRMYKKKTIVRKMDAIESLGATTVICTDKTGTLTTNKMIVKHINIEDRHKNNALRVAVLCNNASLVLTGEKPEVLGDTTEGALLLWAQKEGINIEELRKSAHIEDEKPFNLTTRMMSVTVREKGELITYSKGAPEAILSQTTLSSQKKETETQAYETFAQEGYRILALARNKTYLGFVAIADPPRPEVVQTIQKAQAAGIHIIMLTGDNELTARAIGREIGLLQNDDEVLTGDLLRDLTDEEFIEKAGSIRIIARAQPEDKLRIIKLYQQRGDVVTVTGDGVNDALALKQAQVGVAMGESGTDVAQEAADIVILDDNFSVLIAAIEEGRKIYTNIKKAVTFLLAGNFSELTLIVGAALVGLPTPLLPVQILWVNLVTDGLPALALIADPVSYDVMREDPKKRKTSFFDQTSLVLIIASGLLGGLISLLIFRLTGNRSYAFSSIIVLQMIMVFFVRRQAKFWTNTPLLGSVFLVLVLQILLTNVPLLRSIFKL